MPERNPCLKSGCPGFCCQDIDIEITKSERTRVFPTAIHVDSMKELAQIKKDNLQGLYYTEYSRKGLEGGDFYVIVINGPCPNRLSDGSCLKHDEREYAARNFAIGCSDCNVIRKENGFSPIFIEPVE